MAAIYIYYYHHHHHHFTATTLIYAIGAGITAAAGTRLAQTGYFLDESEMTSFPSICSSTCFEKKPCNISSNRSCLWADCPFCYGTQPTAPMHWTKF